MTTHQPSLRDNAVLDLWLKWISAGTGDATLRDVMMDLPPPYGSRVRNFDRSRPRVFRQRLQTITAAHIGQFMRPVHPSGSAHSAFVISESELKFDIDLDDYDKFAIRVCACRSHKTYCGDCWVFVEYAFVLLRERLRRVFGVPEEHTLAVFSGGRGGHLWVSHPAVNSLKQDARTDLAIGIVSPVTPEEWTDVMEPWLLSNASRLFILPEWRARVCRQVRELAPQCGNFMRRWAQKTPDVVGWLPAFLAASREVGSLYPRLGQRVLSALFCPRLDKEVTTSPQHLGKLPFSLHARTGNYALPLALHPSHPRRLPPISTEMNTAEWKAGVAILDTFLKKTIQVSSARGATPRLNQWVPSWETEQDTAKEKHRDYALPTRLFEKT